MLREVLDGLVQNFPVKYFFLKLSNARLVACTITISITRMRKFIRHPSSIPVRIQKIKSSDATGSTLVNVSYGGLALHFPEYIENGTEIELLIDITEPRFSIKGTVAWTQEKDQNYELGIRFPDNADVFRMRMVEQLCHIEHYRKEVELEQGRKLSSEEAAKEWIETYAEHFPALDQKPG